MTAESKKPRTRAPRKKPSRASASPSPSTTPPECNALAQAPRVREELRPLDRAKRDGGAGAGVKPLIDPLTGDLPGVTLKDARAVLAHFERVDPRLAEAWERDVVVHEGPVTLRRIMRPDSFGGATHYAYVDRRLLWYLSHDPSDLLGARWDGYLANRRDAPPGTVAVIVGNDVVAKKTPSQLGEG